MLFQRYASPMVMLDKMILTGRFHDFVCEFIQIRNEELEDQTRWEFYLHKVFNMDFKDFLAQTARTPETDETITNEALESTVGESRDIINSFCLLN